MVIEDSWGSTFWDGLLESGGELVTEVTDFGGDLLTDVGSFGGDLLTDVTDLGKSWVTSKVKKEADRVQSSSPDEQRKHNNDYQQPTGAPVNTPAMAGINPTYLALGAGALLVLLLVVFYISKGKK